MHYRLENYKLYFVQYGEKLSFNKYAQNLDI